MRVAICDNDKDVVNNLGEILKEINEVTLVVQFNSVYDLSDSMEKGNKFDVLFMNIDWNCEKNGIDYASELTLTDPGMQTIFLDNNFSAYFQQIFLGDINLCGYLEKPIQKNLLQGMMNIALKRINRDIVDKMMIKIKNTTRFIAYGDIIYIESRNRRVYIHTRHGVFDFYGRIDYEKMNLPTYFLVTHQSFVVNINYISQISRKCINLITGDVVNISKAHYANVNSVVLDYFANRKLI